MIIGREYEKKVINNSIESDKSELIAIYGRRRVGKTFLVKQLLGNEFSFYFTGTYMTSKNVQLNYFRNSLCEYFNCDVPKFNDWYEAFNLLKKYLLSLKSDKLIIFFDEMPWMDTAKSDVLKAFSYFWNTWDSSAKLLKVFVCASSTTWMLDKFIGDKGGLYGRITKAIYLAPFTLAETEQFLFKCKNINISRSKIIELYMIMGGIPYYLDMLDANLPIDQNIDLLFFRDNALLRSEFDFLFRSLFNKSIIYTTIVKALETKKGGLTRNEIIETTKIADNGVLSIALKNLISCDFIKKMIPINKKERDAVYRLVDSFTLFYLHFIYKKEGVDTSYWSNTINSHEKTIWFGYSFELVALIHINNIKDRLGIRNVLTNVYSWSNKSFIDNNGIKWDGHQVDIVLDRNDGIIDLLEVKHYNQPFVISSEYEETIRNRMCAFSYLTKTNKAVNNVFITMYGVKNKDSSSICNGVISLDDFFRILD